MISDRALGQALVVLWIGGALCWGASAENWVYPTIIVGCALWVALMSWICRAHH